MRQLNKAQGESDMWRQRYEKDGLGKAEELEMVKGKLQGELDDMAVQLDQAQILNSSMEKKAKQFDRIVTEWKLKVDSLGMDLDGSQKETRNASSELFRIKSAYEEAVLQLEEVRRENK